MKIYKEEQSYRSIYAFGGLGLFAIACCFLSFRELLWSTTTNWTAVIISLSITLAAVLTIRYLIQLKLKTAVSTKSISVKMSPFLLNREVEAVFGMGISSLLN